MDLHDRVVLITGASSGIGAACAREFHQHGARLSLLARTEDKLRAVSAETGAIYTAGDVTCTQDRARAVEATLHRWGRIDILVNNAGIGMYVPAWRADMREVRRLWELNLFSVLEMIQLTVPHFQKQRDGMIVNVSSIAGKVSLPWFTNYAASKFALCALTDSLRIELARWNIRCVTVCPGYVKTAFPENALAGRPPERLWRMRRFSITAEQCAKAIARGIQRESRTIVTPAAGRLLILAYSLAPSAVDYFLARIYRGLDLQ